MEKRVDIELVLPTVTTRDSSRERRLRELVDRHFDAVWRSVRRLGVPEASADDAAQHVFMVASRKLDEIADGRERAYLLGVALRVASDARHAAERRREVSLEDIGAAELPPALPQAEAVLEQKRARQLLEQLLEHMPAEMREAFVLFELEELSAPEVGRLLDIPVGTVASRVRRARAFISEQLARRGKP